jgi:hypothetical protein
MGREDSNSPPDSYKEKGLGDEFETWVIQKTMERAHR